MKEDREVSFAGALVLFVPKKDGSFRLWVDYKGLKKVTRKNQLAFPLISKTLDRLARSVRFTKLDPKNVYYWIKICKGDE